MEMLIQQICEQLQMISVTGMSDIQIVQTDKTTVWCHALRFGKYEEKFTAALTATGKVKKGSIRFYN